MSNDEQPEEAVRKQAFAWYARLHSGDATAADQAEWQRWHGKHPTHARVWQRLETIRATVQRVPGAIAAPSLRAASRDRRNTLRGIVLLASGGVVAGVSWKLVSDDGGWRSVLAEHRTGTGEQREVELADGSRMLLNTRSAVDIDFDASRRTVRLRNGEIQIETAKHAGRPADARPFVVETVHGSIRALGTRFVVSRQDDATTLTMLESRVSVQTAAQRAAGSSEARMVDAGERVRITAQTVGPAEAVDVRSVSDAWAFHQLVVQDRPLAEVLDALARHRPGRIQYDRAQIEGIRVSAVLPLDDTDRALDLLLTNFPTLRMRSFTPYLVLVDAPDAPGRAPAR
jgi:transmembrane sensor